MSDATREEHAAELRRLEGMTLIAEDAQIRPAAMSHVKPSEYRYYAERAMRHLLEDLAAVRKVVQLQADRDWIIAPWLNEAGDYVWRVNVRDTPSKKRGADTYTGTAHVAATALDAGLRALAAQEAGDV